MQALEPIELIDNHQRKINYLRIGITDKCNLRCIYCMPANGMKFMSEKDLISFEEIKNIIKISSELGISKVRFTGGEPFARPGFIDFLKELKEFDKIEFCITTNASLAYEHIDLLNELGIHHLNVSLDSLSPNNFLEITRRNEFEITLKTIHLLIEKGFNLKINVVLMGGKNDHEIPDFIHFAKKFPVEIRLIEEMPFNGIGDLKGRIPLDEKMILERIRHFEPQIQAEKFLFGDTAKLYSGIDWNGKIGIIGAYSRSFCRSCNRLRITPSGEIKNCLYDSGVFNLKKFMREGASNQEIKNKLIDIVGHRFANGIEAEKNRNFKLSESMTTIGG